MGYLEDLAMNELRKIRNQILDKTDKYTTPDFPHSSEEVKQAWLIYRQELRELTNTQIPNYNQSGVLINVSWPIPPNNDILNDIIIPGS